MIKSFLPFVLLCLVVAAISVGAANEWRFEGQVPEHPIAHGSERIGATEAGKGRRSAVVRGRKASVSDLFSCRLYASLIDLCIAFRAVCCKAMNDIR